MINAESNSDGGSGERGAADEKRYRAISLWLDRYPHPLTPRPALDGDTEADVAIVGAGFTGLWTAYYLQRADPTLRIVVVESEIAGFGASGRNGGWCSALFPASWDRIEHNHGRAAALAMRAAMIDSVDQVGAVAAAESIDCGFARGGTLSLARSAAQLTRARQEVADARRFGDDLEFLPAARASERTGAAGVLGATFTPHCAAIDPGALVRGLADVVERRGVRIAERTPATDITPHRISTPKGTVRADVVVRATEAFTTALPGHRRDLAPIYSLIVATEPLDAERLAAVGLADRETFTDFGHLLCYGQRTADGRIVFGGRGAPYHFGSSVAAANDRNERVFAGLRRSLVANVPCPAGRRIHPRVGWCGGRPTRLARIGRPRPVHRPGLGRRICGRRGVDHQPRRTDPRRSDHLDVTPNSRACRGSAIARGDGSPSRCASSASTPACRRPGSPTPERPGPDVRPASE